jgi:hypothetical protein
MELNWDAIGAAGEILGAGAVLITLVYLARQVSHTQISSQLDASERLLRGFDEINRTVVTDSSLRDVLVKEGELSPAESLQLYQFGVLYCNIWMSAQTGYEIGQISKTLYEEAARDVKIELERFPKLRQPILIWLERYPGVSDMEIFRPLRQPASREGD